MTTAKPQLSLYNTLTRTKEAFTPIDANNVRMYVCGPTVYDFAHIGNARPVIVFDVLYRLLRHLYGADHVTYARNITDVDDKINARALRDFPDLPLNDAIRRVTEKTEAQFLADAKALGTLEPNVQPRATDNIAQMVRMIQLLLDKGHAYVARGKEGREALFDVTSMADYGGLSRREASSNLAGARIEVKDHKRNPEDFVLWKESEQSEPGWEAAFVISEDNRAELDLNDTAITIRGRPGWHIECSAMSERYLWEEIADRLSPAAHAKPHQFDIHGGGLDLIFPHHENEIAQSRCAHGTHAMANVWMHNGFLQVEGQKMSKSLGNFYTIHQLMETTDFGGRKWDGEVLRLAMLMTHYRDPIDFSVARLEEARKKLVKWERRGKENAVAISHVDSEFLQALLSDLDTPGAIRQVDRLMSKLETVPDGLSALQIIGINPMRDHPMGVRIDFPPATITMSANLSVRVGISEAEVLQSIMDRLVALNSKNFAEADRIRNELAEQGIALMDYKDENGERATKWEVKR